MNRWSCPGGLRLRAAAVGGLLLMASACGPEDNYYLGPGVWPGSGGTIAAGAGQPAAASGGVIAPPQGGAAPQAGVSAVPVAGVGVAGGGTSGTGVAPTGGTGAVGPAPDAGMPSGFDSGIEPNRNDVQAGAICQRMATLQCAAEAHCCSNPGRTFDACKAAQLKVCGTDLAFDDIARNPVSGFSAPHTAAALAMLEQLSSQCDQGVGLWFESPEGLRSMLQGTVAPEGACMPPAGLPSLAGYGAALASCTQPTTHACLFSGTGPLAAPTSATCAPRADAGATCFVDTNCKDNLTCNNPTAKYSMGTCGARQPVGAACTSGSQCESKFCRGKVCVAASQQAAYCLQN